MIINGTREEQLMGTVFVRKLFTGEDFPAKDVLKSKGLLKKFVEFLDCSEDKSLQLEASWIMANMTAGLHCETKAVINAGALPRIIKLIDSTDEDLQENALWTMANIAGDSKKLRDMLFSSNVLEPILKLLLSNNVTEKNIKEAILCLSNLCMDKNSVSIENMKKILPVLNHLLKTETNEESLIDVCKTISSLSNGPFEYIQAVIDFIDLKRLLELLDNDKMTAPVLRVFGNIATGEERHTEVVVQLGLIEHLSKLIETSRKSLKDEVYWMLSNIAAGSKSQIQVGILETIKILVKY